MWDDLNSAIKESEEFTEWKEYKYRMIQNQIVIMEALKTIMETQHTLLLRTSDKKHLESQYPNG